ncbi:MAG: type II toxin-antitoxin system antitoxin SocA domain-containing protein [Saprospiraceae bacterium]
MKDNITQTEIGRRIEVLRKQKGWSQEDLAKHIRISRSSLTQIELGNRSIDIMELQSLAMVLGFSIDDFVSVDFQTDTLLAVEENEEPKSAVERISIPALKVDKFKNILLYILERCAGKPNVGETVLYKLLYFADFNYYELYEEQMTGATYRKLQYGPVPQKMDKIISDMTQSNQLQRLNVNYFDKVQTRFIPLVKPDLTQLKASEKDVIDRVIDQMGDWSATMISDYSHGDKPWKATAINEDLNYELAFYRRPPYSVRVYEDDERDEI